ncbi:MAG: tetratricopeptide repeat protein [Lactobacillus sp.]|jgi:tetratricopeptide (TPR) repeat protein|uniref:Tetratricopeptide repeat protein n=1 Tax=Lacticaseibacillus suilingensis TaxID=2799577 RepID=A0ABW4BE73_9LACO|nr:tetratricopeptide repeat protein [Lacticaseibacillus suilingensis]MCI1893354.1 tetratricopeptide repeat protein [Lactobacillus sp.]MCI1917452.1 tetratricopeptide repeat protein [Lactobacillus sp.]MCI1940539.1 tetratricopeptide repeat protein [Lactobacillus sp.]MCI1971056.1 tetratricopeptide repeat protein [Lactobacillus sp.]MCI2017372.1 tetratricopeptide repeat protein [Lactobacillus sp.]
MSYSEQMLAALEAGHMAEARELFQSVLKNDDDETKYNLAGELYALGFTGQAQRLYEELMGKYPDQDDLKTALADIAVGDDLPDKALGLLSQITPDSDFYPQALLAAADVYQTQGLYEVSEQKLLEAQQLVPDEPVVTFALGELYNAWGRDDRASLAYSQLLAAGIDEFAQVNIKARYGGSLANLGQYEDAVAVYEDAGVATLDAESQLRLGTLYAELDQPKDAIATLQGLIEADPTYANAYLPLAKAQVKGGASADALATVQAGLMQDDTNPDLFAYGATLALQEDNLDLAETYLTKARHLDPENQAVAMAWSNLLLAKHDDEANVAYLEAMDKSDEVDPQIYWNLAKSYDRLDEVAKARENYLLAFNALQDSVLFLHDLIDFFQSTGAKAELKAALTRYLALAPTDTDMQERLDELEAEEDQ